MRQFCNPAFQKLEQLRRTLLAGETGIEISGFNFTGIGGSDKAREAARTQLTVDALAEARDRAEALAKSAGLQLGRIGGVTERDLGAGYPGASPGLFAVYSASIRFAVKCSCRGEETGTLPA